MTREIKINQGACPLRSLTQDYTYDGVNRLLTATETGNSWSRTFGYDVFGNRWVASANEMLKMATPTAIGQFDPATNRLTKTYNNLNLPADAYDSAGNLTNHPHVAMMTYDAEIRQTSFNGPTATYSYDGEGRRVKKIQGTETTVFVYDAFGKLGAEYQTELDQELMAGTFYRTLDHLGSTRLITDQSGNAVSCYDHYPFGEEIEANNSHGDRQIVPSYNKDKGIYQRFTGKERDEESGLDYFLARYYSAPMGRFMSVDPENAGASLADPQAWNGYAYVTNRPLVLTDPDGRCPNCATGAAGFGIGFLVGAGAETFRQARDQFAKGGRIQLDGNKILAKGVGTSVFPSLGPAAGKEAARQSGVIVSGAESATKPVVSQPVKQFVNSEVERFRKKEEDQ